MKTKVIIENKATTIILTPENEFEEDVIDKVYCKKEKFTLSTNVGAKYNYGTYSQHRIEISINEVSQKQ